MVEYACGEQTFGPPTQWGSLWTLALIGQEVSEEKTFEAFYLYETMKTSDPWDGGHFYPRAIILIILVEVPRVESYKIKLLVHTTYQRPWPSSFRQEDFKVLSIEVDVEKLDLSVKRSYQGHVVFKLYWAYVPSAAYQTLSHWPFRSGEEDFKRFLPYMGVGRLDHVTRCGEQTFVPDHEGSIWNLHYETRLFKYIENFTTKKMKIFR